MLTTLNNVKAWLNLKAENTDADAMLTRLIQSASTFAESWMGRTILATQYTERRDGTGKDVLMTANWPVIDVASVVIDGQSVPANQVLPAERSIVLRGGVFTRGRGNVDLVYTAGYVAVPPDIEQAVIELVALRFRERDRIGHQSKSLDGETVSFFIGELTPSARAILSQYKKVVPI